jgi:hypothetical protein
VEQYVCRHFSSFFRSDGNVEAGTVMRAGTIWRNLAACGALFALAVPPSANAAHRPQAATPLRSEAVVLIVDPAHSTVHYTVGSTLHTVHGTFAVKRGTLRIDPESGKATGEFVVDAASGSSGNQARDKKMHSEVLKSARFSEIAFRPDRVEGAVRTQGASDARLHGLFEILGNGHELTVPVEAELGPDHWEASANFSIPYNDWGLKNPGNLFLRVDHSVTIEVHLAGSLQTQSAAASRR